MSTKHSNLRIEDCRSRKIVLKQDVHQPIIYIYIYNFVNTCTIVHIVNNRLFLSNITTLKLCLTSNVGVYIKSTFFTFFFNENIAISLAKKGLYKYLWLRALSEEPHPYKSSTPTQSLKFLLLFPIQGSTPDYIGCTFLVQLFLESLYIKKKKNRLSEFAQCKNLYWLV